MEEMKSIRLPKVVADLYLNSDEILYQINEKTGEYVGYVLYKINSETVFRILFRSLVSDDSISRITKLFIIDDLGIDKYIVSIPMSIKDKFGESDMKFIINSRSILSSDSEGEIISKLLKGFDEEYIERNWEKIRIEEINSPSELFRIEKV